MKALLGGLVLLASAAAPLLAGPTLSPATVEQCDGSFVAGESTNKQSPQIRVPVQDNDGLKTGQDRPSIVPSATVALWRFNNFSGASSTIAYTATDTGCLPEISCKSTFDCRRWNWTFSDPNGSPTINLGHCGYSASSTTPSCTGNAPMTLDQFLVVATTPISPLPFVGGCPASTATAGVNNLPTGASDYSFVTPGRFGNSRLDVNGTKYGVVPVTATFNFSGNYTLSAWIRSSATGLQRIISHQDATKYWGFGLNAGGLRRFDSREAGGNQDNTVGAGLNDGQWHQVAVVRVNGQTWRFFKDGQLMGTTPAASAGAFSTGFSTTGVVIGSFGGGGEFFNGQIDELRVMIIAYSDEAVAADYHATLHKFSTDGGSNFSYVFHDSATAYVPAIVSGSIIPVKYLPPLQLNITTLHKYIFIAQGLDGITAVSPTSGVTVDTSGPSAPASLVGAGATPSDIVWTWTAPIRFCGPPTAAATYTLVNPGDASTITTTLHPVVTASQNFGSDPPNQMHSAAVKITDLYGTGPLTAAASAYTLANAPVSLTTAAASISTSSLVLQWGAANNPSYTRYEVSTATNDFSSPFAFPISTPTAIADNYTATTRSFTGLASGTTYWFRVRAFNGRASDGSGTNFTAFSVNDFITRPAAPPIAGATVSSRTVRFDWSLVSGATGYRLYAPDGVLLTDTPGLTFTSGPFTANQGLTVQLEAYNRSGAGPRSSAFAFTQATSPVSVAISAVSTYTLTLAWDPNGNSSATTFEVVAATEAVFLKPLSTTTVSTTTATLGDLFPGSTYFLRVRAIGGNGLASSFEPGAPLKAVTYIPPNLSFSTSPTTPYVSQPALIGAWHLDAGAGTTATDAAPTGNPGSLLCLSAGCTSTPTWTAGPPGLGKAVSFLGLPESLIRIPDNAAYNFAGSISVSVWAKPSTLAQPGGAGLVAKGNGGAEAFSLDVSGGKYRFLITPLKTVASTSSIRVDQWDHVIGVFDAAAAELRIYVNGRLSATATGAGGARTINANPVTIGNRKSGTTQHDLGFAGTLDEPRLYNKAFTDAEALAEYQSGVSAIFTPPAPNNAFQIVLPPDAFTSGQAVIFVSSDPLNQPVRPGNLVSTALNLVPTGQILIAGTLLEIVPTINGVPFTGNLGSPATIYMPYPDANGDGLLDGTLPPIPVSRLKAYTFNPATLIWDELPAQIDSGNRRLLVRTTHFTVFGEFGTSSFGTALTQIRIFPVPWRPGSGGKFDAAGLAFDRLPTRGSVRIFGLAGERVAEFKFDTSHEGGIFWDGRNAVGHPVASGVYFAHVRSDPDGNQRTLKFAIER